MTGLPADSTEPVLSMRDLRVAYPTARGPLHAVDRVDLDLFPGERVGLVGESGCGKSTLGRAALQLLPPGARTGGSIRLAGEELVGAGPRRLREVRGQDITLVFQEPTTRLDPLMTVAQHFVETIRAHRPEVSRRDAVQMGRDVLARMGIPPTRISRYPHEFSGGMRQRIMLGLAIVLRPRVVVADEPTTALDVIVEAQILQLLSGLSADGLAGGPAGPAGLAEASAGALAGAGSGGRGGGQVALLLISHNLAVVAQTCQRVAVMYAGRIVEVGPTDQVFGSPGHPYTQALLRSLVDLDTRELFSIPGQPPDLVAPPPGCRYRPRCPVQAEGSDRVDPSLVAVAPDHRVACLLYDDEHARHDMHSPGGSGAAT